MTNNKKVNFKLINGGSLLTVSPITGRKYDFKKDEVTSVIDPDDVIYFSTIWKHKLAIVSEDGKLLISDDKKIKSKSYHLINNKSNDKIEEPIPYIDIEENGEVAVNNDQEPKKIKALDKIATNGKNRKRR